MTRFWNVGFVLAMLRASLKLQLISCLWPPGRISPLFSPGPAAEKGYNVVFSPTDRKEYSLVYPNCNSENYCNLEMHISKWKCKDIVQNKGLKNNKISNFCAISGFLDTFIFNFSNILVFFYQISGKNVNSIFFVKIFKHFKTIKVLCKCDTKFCVSAPSLNA